MNYLKSKSKMRFNKSNDRFVAGVMGGIAEYFGWDKALTRIIALVLIILSHGLLLIPYFILAWLMPSKTTNAYEQFTSRFNFMRDQGSTKKKKRKEIKNAEEHDVND
ncbi:PspC domain-containing protein [Pediococcus stilesii]|uniref:PspC domain-containing protein n=1 Tax=Pediococcus stilesii TaxID=331679 RepID=UPI00207917DF|nr:PspC domain-containing protein [Pediococcus stilesii]